MKALLIILLCLPLLAPARAPASVVPSAPQIYRVRLAVARSARTQACTFDTATSRLRQEIADPIGYPYGFVTAWSCTGDGFAVAQELATRASAMQAEAAAYRAAHPIVGLR